MSNKRENFFSKHTKPFLVGFASGAVAVACFQTCNNQELANNIYDGPEYSNTISVDEAFPKKDGTNAIIPSIDSLNAAADTMTLKAATDTTDLVAKITGTQAAKKAVVASTTEAKTINVSADNPLTVDTDQLLDDLDNDLAKVDAALGQPSVLSNALNDGEELFEQTQDAEAEMRRAKYTAPITTGASVEGETVNDTTTIEVVADNAENVTRSFVPNTEYDTNISDFIPDSLKIDPADLPNLDNDLAKIDAALGQPSELSEALSVGEALFQKQKDAEAEMRRSKYTAPVTTGAFVDGEAVKDTVSTETVTADVTENVTTSFVADTENDISISDLIPDSLKIDPADLPNLDNDLAKIDAALGQPSELSEALSVGEALFQKQKDAEAEMRRSKYSDPVTTGAGETVADTSANTIGSFVVDTESSIELLDLIPDSLKIDPIKAPAVIISDSTINVVPQDTLDTDMPTTDSLPKDHPILSVLDDVKSGRVIISVKDGEVFASSSTKEEGGPRTFAGYYEDYKRNTAYAEYEEFGKEGRTYMSSEDAGLGNAPETLFDYENDVEFGKSAPDTADVNKAFERFVAPEEIAFDETIYSEGENANIKVTKRGNNKKIVIKGNNEHVASGGALPILDGLEKAHILVQGTEKEGHFMTEQPNELDAFVKLKTNDGQEITTESYVQDRYRDGQVMTVENADGTGYTNYQNREDVHKENDMTWVKGEEPTKEQVSADSAKIADRIAGLQDFARSADGNVDLEIRKFKSGRMKAVYENLETGEKETFVQKKNGDVKMVSVSKDGKLVVKTKNAETKIAASSVVRHLAQMTGKQR